MAAVERCGCGFGGLLAVPTPHLPPPASTKLKVISPLFRMHAVAVKFTTVSGRITACTYGFTNLFSCSITVCTPAATAPPVANDPPTFEVKSSMGSKLLISPSIDGAALPL